MRYKFIHIDMVYMYIYMYACMYTCAHYMHVWLFCMYECVCVCLVYRSIGSTYLDTATPHWTDEQQTGTGNNPCYCHVNRSYRQESHPSWRLHQRTVIVIVIVVINPTHLITDCPHYLHCASLRVSSMPGPQLFSYRVRVDLISSNDTDGSLSQQDFHPPSDV